MDTQTKTAKSSTINPIEDMVIHIGYARALSTWLQKHVWSNRSAGFEAPAWTPQRLSEIRDELVMIHPLAFNASRFRARWAPMFEESARNALVPVLTMERLSGSPVTGSYDSKEISERLQEAFPEARIVICVREQVGMLFSQYHRYVAAGGTLPLERYASTRNKDPRWPTFNFETFEYDLLVSQYMRLFGEENVLVCPLEMFKSDPHAYLERIFAFTGRSIIDELPVHRGESINHPTVTLSLKRLFNQFIYHSGGFQQRRFTTKLRKLRNYSDRFVPMAVEFKTQQRLRAQVGSLLGERYRGSNRRLAALSALDLGSLGYPV